MATLLYVLTHSTDDPDRAVTGLLAALAAQQAGHDVALWLTGEGVRLGIQGVAQTLDEPGDEEAGASTALRALQQAGAILHLDKLSFDRRQFDHDAVCDGAQVAEPAGLADLLAAGRLAVTL